MCILSGFGETREGGCRMLASSGNNLQNTSKYCTIRKALIESGPNLPKPPALSCNSSFLYFHSISLWLFLKVRGSTL